LVPVVRRWLRAFRLPPDELVEPFAGGGIVSLTAVFEDLVKHATMIEIDPDVAAVWRTILNGQGRWLADEIRNFELNRENVLARLRAANNVSLRQRAFATILRNRVSRGGILAPGAGLVKSGENGKGLKSRWYPRTLSHRILQIVYHKGRLSFTQGDGIEILTHEARRPGTVYFLDPPYTIAGKRLYRYPHIDHEGLFRLASSLAGDFLMTYDDTDEIRRLAQSFDFQIMEVPMKGTHNKRKTELVIGRSLDWVRS
jgi:DNA adenine methylase